jgi:hypothetical protein
VPHDNVLDQVADRDQNAGAAGVNSVTHYAVPISRTNRIRLSGLAEEPPPGPLPTTRAVRLRLGEPRTYWAEFADGCPEG